MTDCFADTLAVSRWLPRHGVSVSVSVSLSVCLSLCLFALASTFERKKWRYNLFAFSIDVSKLLMSIHKPQLMGRVSSRTHYKYPSLCTSVQLSEQQLHEATRQDEGEDRTIYFERLSISVSLSVCLSVLSDLCVSWTCEHLRFNCN